jgi:hypothetical protein
MFEVGDKVEGINWNSKSFTGEVIRVNDNSLVVKDNRGCSLFFTPDGRIDPVGKICLFKVGVCNNEAVSKNS